MLKECHGNQNLSYTGTIIDIETKGDYCSQYKCKSRDINTPRDSREYQEHKLVIFGYVNRRGFHIYCARGNEGIQELEEKARQLLAILEHEKPLYAFNCHQEMSVFFHHLQKKVVFDKELQSREYEPKEEALRTLGIFDSFGDPFQNEGKPGSACQIAWSNGHYDNAIQHNRACLLKEQTLLLKGRGIIPIPLDFKERDSSYIKLDLSLSNQPWTSEQEDLLKREWSNGGTIRSIAQECKRSENAVWMRLRNKLRLIPADIPYDPEKKFWTIKDLP
jgi:hypothetical protein